MRLDWQVTLVDDTQPNALVNLGFGYGATANAALASLQASIDQKATDAQDHAARVTAAMVRVRGELEALDAA